MNHLDVIVVAVTLSLITAYGIWKGRQANKQSFIRGGDLKWGVVGLSVMATQASAITFLSMPGLAYDNGMAFIQNYFGLPLALIVVSAFFVTAYYRQRVYTAYEFLGRRFGCSTQVLGSSLFIIQRGLASGITLYAPAIVLSEVLGWSLDSTILISGVLVIAYTLSGGTEAVSYTQKYQMATILCGIGVAFGFILAHLPESVGTAGALKLAGAADKLNAVDFSFDPEKRYTIWSGLLGGGFLALSYFGTDQSQVQRYLAGRNRTAARMGLMFNAVMKIPLQFVILLMGALLLVFYQFEGSKIDFRPNHEAVLEGTELAAAAQALQADFRHNTEIIQTAAHDYLSNPSAMTQARYADAVGVAEGLRRDYKQLLQQADPGVEAKDSDYIFIDFVMGYLPHGVIGLLIAVIMCAAMSSTASELNALASVATIDYYVRLVNPSASEKRQLLVSRLFTVMWGLVALAFAMMASMAENMIEAVNILGSLFYGAVLGIFIAGLFIRYLKGRAVFIGGVLAQLIVLCLFFTTSIGYLWFNLIGCVSVIVIAVVIQASCPPRKVIE